MERFVCIHAHFYQPPRENAWLEAVELQDSAYPYHDWNERITAECYGPNAASRILDEHGRIIDIVNNYSAISFNFGPTLLCWLERHAPEVYSAILEADRESGRRFSGHGSALAQAYNHMILPLANPRDKITQVLWGIKDFEYRFRRKPEGMWLPETAVDLATLEVLADCGILFTILAPRQAKRVKAMDKNRWRDVSGTRIDPTRAYLIRLSSGKTINLFFYDGPVSRAVAFEGLLYKGETFAHRLLDAFPGERSEPALIHIATDGESYGHHHPNGDMALAYALHYIESHGLARITNYGEFLEKHPPTHEVEIFENSSWSCSHGIERWYADCGCNSGQHPNWRQTWRTPLREALDWLRDALAPAYEKEIQGLVKDPWAARNDYIRVIFARSQDIIAAFFEQNASKPLSDSDRIRVIELMELQRNAMLMYTSCGWFFDDVSGIETVQIIQYAGRVLQTAKKIFGESMEPHFLELLNKAESNLSAHGNGRRLYEKFVVPAIVDLKTVAAHYALSSLFEEYPEETSIYCYTVRQEAYRTSRVGRARLAIGQVAVTSQITLQSSRFSYGVMHWGDHNMSGCLMEDLPSEHDNRFADEIFDAFDKASFPETLLLLEKLLGPTHYSLRNLFRDQQRRILHMILESTLVDVEQSYRQINEANAPLLRFLTDKNIPPPQALLAAAQYVMDMDLIRSFEKEDTDGSVIQTLLESARLQGISLDSATLEITIRRRLESMMNRLLAAPADIRLLGEIEAIAHLLKALPFDVNLRRIQNIYYAIMKSYYPDCLEKASQENKEVQQWIGLFKSLGDILKVSVS